jgi:hypothetical protein
MTADAMRRSIALLVLLLLPATPVARAYPANDFLLAAFAAEQNATHKRIDLDWNRGPDTTHYVIERVLPDRVRVVTRGTRGDGEVIVIGSRMYQRTNGSWRTSSAAVPVELLPLPSDLFRNRLGPVTEGPAMTDNGVALRSFSGSITWTSAVSPNSGTIQFVVEAVSKLPRRMSFRGTCGGVACGFDQTFSYGAGISIDPPV